MEKRDKVISGLEHCTLDEEGYPHCHGCPYGPVDVRCVGRLAIDALLVIKAVEMLKVQEPRLMTLEEIRNAEVVYLERTDTESVIPVLVSGLYGDRIGFVQAYIQSGIPLRFVLVDQGFNTYWRCWTSRPTREQTEATPWL